MTKSKVKTPSRRRPCRSAKETPLRVVALLSSNIQFRIKQRTSNESSDNTPGSSRVFKLTEVPLIHIKHKLIKLRISARDSIHSGTGGQEEHQEYRTHNMKQIGVLVDKKRRDVDVVNAKWMIKPNGDVKTVYSDGFVRFCKARIDGSLGDVIVRENLGLAANDDPSAPFRAKINLPTAEGDMTCFDIKVEGMYTETMIMHASATVEKTVELKFTLTVIRGPDGHIEMGKMEILSKGITGNVRKFKHLQGLIFVMWLIYSDEDRSCFERWI